MIKVQHSSAYHGNNPSPDPSTKGPLIASVIFHIFLFVLTAVGVPFVAKDHQIISAPLSVEIVEIDKKTTTKEPPKIRKPIKKEKKPEPKQDKPAKPLKMDSPTPPTPDVLESVSIIPKSKPKVPPVKKPKIEEKKPEKPKKDFSTLLKNLAPDSPEEPQEQPAQAAALDERVTISEMDALRRQLASCWNIPSGAKYAEQLVVEIRLTVNPDRSVQSASILDKGRYNRDSYFQAAADAALRAIRDPRCSPLALPPEKYNQWKVMTIGFDPSQML